MSRIGNAPIQIPDGVSLEQNESMLTVKGPKGTLSRQLPKDIILEHDGNVLNVKRPTDGRTHRALHGLTRTLVSNMVEGVSKGFVKVLELYGVGYRAQLQGTDALNLQLGFSHPVILQALEGVSFALETFVPNAENGYLSCRITVTGIDREAVGQTSANLRAKKKPEPYKGKGIRYRGEKVRRKPGKAAKAQR